MDAPRALVFRLLVKGNEALGTRLSVFMWGFWNEHAPRGRKVTFTTWGLGPRPHVVNVTLLCRLNRPLCFHYPRPVKNLWCIFQFTDLWTSIQGKEKSTQVQKTLVYPTNAILLRTKPKRFGNNPSRWRCLSVSHLSIFILTISTYLIKLKQSKSCSSPYLDNWLN